MVCSQLFSREQNQGKRNQKRNIRITLAKRLRGAGQKKDLEPARVKRRAGYSRCNATVLSAKDKTHPANPKSRTPTRKRHFSKVPFGSVFVQPSGEQIPPVAFFNQKRLSQNFKQSAFLLQRRGRKSKKQSTHFQFEAKNNKKHLPTPYKRA